MDMVCPTLVLAPLAEGEKVYPPPRDAHPFCFVCSASNPMGLAVRYQSLADGSVSAVFLGHPALEGYPGLLHGGIIAAILDGAMTHCLLSRGVKALTAELSIRYHLGIEVAEELSIRAWPESSAHGLHRLRAEIVQGDTIRASALGKFIEPHD